MERDERNERDLTKTECRVRVRAGVEAGARLRAKSKAAIRTGENLLSCPPIPRTKEHIYCDPWRPFIMNKYLKQMIQSPRNPNAESETCEESAGVFRFDDWVMIYGSYGEQRYRF